MLVYQVSKPDPAVITYIVLKNLNMKTSKKIANDLKKFLPRYFVPQIIILKDFPYLANRKIDRHKMLDIYEESVLLYQRKSAMMLQTTIFDKSKQSYAKEVIKIIISCLQDDLIKEVTLESNFFELGGNSVNALYTVTNLNEHGFYITLEDFVNSANIAQVLNKISTTKSEIFDIGSIKTMRLVSVSLDKNKKDLTIDFMASSLFQNHEVNHLINEIKLEHYKEVLEITWDHFIS